MILVKVDALMVGNGLDGSVVVLRPFIDVSPEPRVLPIYIGLTEAHSIGMALEGKVRERPQTHDLLLDCIDALEGAFVRCVIDRVDGMVFYAKIVLEQDDDIIEIDARPSDAIALAVRAGAQIYVEPTVFTAASVAASSEGGVLEEREMEAFHAFVESLSPEDFKASGSTAE